MEKRKSERVQFFQLSIESDLEPVWVFRHAQQDSVLGLLVDISVDGLQVLTDKSSPLVGDGYQLIIHADEPQNRNFISVQVHRLWSKEDGTLYIRNGFAFSEGGALIPSIEKLLAARAAGQQWLRCEFVAI